MTPEQRKAYNQKYYKEHKQDIIRQHRQYRMENAEFIASRKRDIYRKKRDAQIDE